MSKIIKIFPAVVAVSIVGMVIFNNLPNKKSEEKPADDVIKIKTSELDALTRQAQGCAADNEALKDRIDSEKEAARSEGEISCLNKIDAAKGEGKKEALVEVVNVVDELKDKMRAYSFSHAVVNGECEGTLSDGSRKRIFLKNNACLNVVNKLVSNNADVVGLLGAVSPEALVAGVLSIDCYTGKAAIRLIDKKCTEALATGLGGVISVEKK